MELSLFTPGSQILDSMGLVKSDPVRITLAQGTEVLAKRPDGLDAFICTHHGTFHCDEVRSCF